LNSEFNEIFASILLALPQTYRGKFLEIMELFFIPLPDLAILIANGITDIIIYRMKLDYT